MHLTVNRGSIFFQFRRLKFRTTTTSSSFSLFYSKILIFYVVINSQCHPKKSCDYYLPALTKFLFYHLLRIEVVASLFTTFNSSYTQFILRFWHFFSPKIPFNCNTKDQVFHFSIKIINYFWYSTVFRSISFLYH